MKKIISLILSITMIASLPTFTTAFAENEITVELDGQKIEFDVNPEIIDDRTMVPLRKIFEEIGALVKWDSETQTVSARKNSKTITLAVGSSDLQIDKGKTDDDGNPIIETVTLEVPAQIVSGRTLVPARAISESFGLNVSWDEDNRKVVITSDDEKDDSWKENVGSVNLSDLTFEGEGVEIDGNQIKISAGGDFTLTGTLDDGNITISSKEKVKLRLSGADITSANGPCIFFEDADKAYITLSDTTENTLTALNSDDGAIYSKENLEIKGDGKLIIESKAGHGIKASDNLTVENGNIIINAESDGIHINDTFKMSGGTIDITSIGDGIDCESIVNISGGKIDIETNGTPTETEQTAPENAHPAPENAHPAPENAQPAPETNPGTPRPKQRRGMWEEEADVVFEKSTKGINAEWMMIISAGEFNINSASHTIHCQDEIEISGGKFVLSSKYDKGISAHGNLTIGGSNTEIDVTKSTEGIESKNVMTINDGIIKVVSTDDALNATGGNSGMMIPGGFGGNGGFGRFGGNGGNFVPPEGFGNFPGFSSDGQTDENAQAPTNQGRRPVRGENGQSGTMRPMPENGKLTQPPADGENKTFMPPFEMNENGEFVMPDGNVMQPGENRPFAGGMGGMGGMGRNMKECLIINGGSLELCGNDDCLDANGNMTINGGTIKAANPTGAFTGNFGVLDADGQTTISEKANIILAASSGRSISISQNSIIVYCENTHTAGDKITLTDSNGTVIYEYAPQGNYKAVLIASDSIKSGEKYSVSVGSEVFETEITKQNTIIGTQPSGGMGFDRRPRMQ